jgi:hypothetical protein
MTGDAWQGPTTCVAAPSLSGHQIYQHMRVDVNGPGSWHEAESYAEQTNTELAAAEQAVRKYQTHLAEGASGGSWDKAH